MPRYELVVRGAFAEDSIDALAGFTKTVDGDMTVLRGELASDHDLAAVLDEFGALGLGLHALRQLPEQDGTDARPPAAPR